MEDKPPESEEEELRKILSQTQVEMLRLGINRVSFSRKSVVRLRKRLKHALEGSGLELSDLCVVGDQIHAHFRLRG